LHSPFSRKFLHISYFFLTITEDEEAAAEDALEVELAALMIGGECGLGTTYTGGVSFLASFDCG
jgi:hypothetical protein